ncbi:hypothetical protein [Alphaproteobacteria bacterium endosymbiont of Tiliacea citrago]|uniref:type II secretion system protein GspD n=1 Tax=Alphaproteobacteria bacterium endosymbiont of Tiliacea citrago TaxID=3077944 RepID=UPI00313B9E03
MKNKNFLLLLIALFLLTGCEKKKIKAPLTIIEKEKETLNIIPKKEKKLSIKKEWLQPCSVMFTDEVDCAVVLRKIASSLGVTLSFNKELKINYKANKKPFINVLLEICHQLNNKIIINDLNANIEEDVQYLHNYYLGNLSSSIGTEFSTSVDHSFGDQSKGNVSKSFYKNNNNYYEMISNNLTAILTKDHTFTINAQAGIISVVAPQKIHKKISLFLNSIKKRLNDQVLVEAKVLEIELFDEFSFGVDFDKLSKDINEKLPNSMFTGGVKNNMLTFVSDFGVSTIKNIILNFLVKYGKTSSISNPYLLISNNHVGIFKSVENKIYFKFKSETVMNDKYKVGATNKQTDFVTYPVGVTFSVHVVKLENNLIKLYIKPTVTEVSKEIEDIGYDFVSCSKGNKKNESKIPIIKTREMESVLVLRDGQYAIIGGLIDTSSYEETQLTKKAKKAKKTELIILLKVQSIDNDEEEDIYDYLIEK